MGASTSSGFLFFVMLVERNKYLWKDHSRCVMSNLANLYEDGQFVDCFLYAEGQMVKCHRAILTASSPYFKNMFTKYPHIKSFHLDDLKYEHLKLVIDFMYYGSVTLDSGKVTPFLRLAQLLHLKIKLASSDYSKASSMLSNGTSRKTESDVLMSPLTYKVYKPSPPCENDCRSVDGNVVELHTEFNVNVEDSIHSPEGIEVPLLPASSLLSSSGISTNQERRKSCSRDCDRSSVLSQEFHSEIIIKSEVPDPQCGNAGVEEEILQSMGFPCQEPRRPGSRRDVPMGTNVSDNEASTTYRTFRYLGSFLNVLDGKDPVTYVLEYLNRNKTFFEEKFTSLYDSSEETSDDVSSVQCNNVPQGRISENDLDQNETEENMSSTRKEIQSKENGCCAIPEANATVLEGSQIKTNEETHSNIVCQTSTRNIHVGHNQIKKSVPRRRKKDQNETQRRAPRRNKKGQNMKQRTALLKRKVDQNETLRSAFVKRKDDQNNAEKSAVRKIKGDQNESKKGAQSKRKENEKDAERSALVKRKEGENDTEEIICRKRKEDQNNTEKSAPGETLEDQNKTQASASTNNKESHNETQRRIALIKRKVDQNDTLRTALVKRKEDQNEAQKTALVKRKGNEKDAERNVAKKRKDDQNESQKCSPRKRKGEQSVIQRSASTKRKMEENEEFEHINNTQEEMLGNNISQSRPQKRTKIAFKLTTLNCLDADEVETLRKSLITSPLYVSLDEDSDIDAGTLDETVNAQDIMERRCEFNKPFSKDFVSVATEAPSASKRQNLLCDFPQESLNEKQEDNRRTEGQNSANDVPKDSPSVAQSNSVTNEEESLPILPGEPADDASGKEDDDIQMHGDVECVYCPKKFSNTSMLFVHVTECKLRATEKSAQLPKATPPEEGNCDVGTSISKDCKQIIDVNGCSSYADGFNARNEIGCDKQTGQIIQEGMASSKQQLDLRIIEETNSSKARSNLGVSLEARSSKQLHDFCIQKETSPNKQLSDLCIQKVTSPCRQGSSLSIQKEKSPDKQSSTLCIQKEMHPMNSSSNLRFEEETNTSVCTLEVGSRKETNLGVENVGREVYEYNIQEGNDVIIEPYLSVKEKKTLKQQLSRLGVSKTNSSGSVSNMAVQKELSCIKVATVDSVENQTCSSVPESDLSFRNEPNMKKTVAHISEQKTSSLSNPATKLSAQKENKCSVPALDLSVDKETSKCKRELPQPIAYSECSYCHMKFSVISLLVDHIIECRLKSGKRNASCGDTTGTEGSSDLNKDSESSTGRKDFYECDVCDKNYFTKYSLIMHRSTHVEWQIFECQICMKKFANRPFLEKHLEIHCKERSEVEKSDVGEESTTDDVTLSKAGVSGQYWSVEKKTDTVNQFTFRCEFCFRMYLTSFSLEKHLQIHSKAPFQCTFCGKCCSDQEALRVHATVHRNNGLFMCRTCGKNFVCKRSREQHQAVHAADRVGRTYDCKKCGAVFQRLGQLSGHMRCHTDCNAVRPFKCPCCPKNYLKRKELISHLRGKHPEVPIQVRRKFTPNRSRIAGTGCVLSNKC